MSYLKQNWAANDLVTSQKMNHIEQGIEDTFNAILSNVYPVGSIYISVNNVNPSSYLTGTTWVAFAEGRTLVGMGSNGTDSYSTVESTGGASAHSIGVTNLPEHTHSIPSLSGSTTAADNVGSTTSDNKHRHSVTNVDNLATMAYNPGDFWGILGKNGTTSTGEVGAHSHKLNIPSLSVTTTASSTDGSTDCNGTALSTIDPYITVYMWKRTA